MKNTRSVFYKYVISFFVVALLPIGIGVASFYQFNIKSLQEQTQFVNEQKLKQTTELLDTIIYHHFKVASSIIAESSLQYSKLLGSTYDRYQSLSLLRPYLNRNQELEKGFLLMKESDDVYSANGIMSYDTMSEMVLKLNEEEAQFLKNMLEENKAYNMLNKEVSDKYLLFLHPIPTYRPYANLMFVMEKEEIGALFDEAMGEENSKLLLTWQGRAMLSDFSLEESKQYENLLMQRENETTGSMDISGKKGSENEVLFCRSEKTGITYVVSFSANSLMMRKLQQQKDLMILLCFVMLFLCIGLAFLVASFTYKPIRELLRLLDKPIDRKNELQALHDYIEGQKELTDSIDWQTPYVQQRIMELYLEGMIEDKEQGKAFSQFRVSGEGNRYFAIVININGKTLMNSSMYRQEILNLSLEIELKKDVHICHMEQLKDSAIVWIVNAREDCFSDMVLLIQTGLEGILGGTRCIPFAVGIGNMVADLTAIRSSFYEALATAEYLKEHVKGVFLYYKDLAEVLQQEELPETDFVMKLIQALRKGDRILSKELFLQYYDKLILNYKSQILLKYFIFKFYNMLLQSLKEYGNDQIKEEMAQAASIEDMRLQKEKMEHLLETICVYRAASLKRNQQELSNKILTFIRQNVFNSSLSLEQMGDEFGLSPYYISRYMTEQTGENLKNYIARLRMEEAKRLLSNTELPLYEIVTKIGYLDVSSFIRKFKKEAGMTPGEFRERFEQKKEQ